MDQDEKIKKINMEKRGKKKNKEKNTPKTSR